MESEEECNEGGERIYVSVRVRPLNSKEILKNEVLDWECINDKTIVYKNVSLSASERSMYPNAYTFDKVFRSDCSTREVYEQGAKNVALSVVSGMNSSVFAYGQTSSGKTYTMFGVTEYAIADIYDYIQKHPEREFVLRFSAMEIYNESVRDLLSVDYTPLRLLDDPERGTIVEKLTEEILRDWDHVIELLSLCEAQRQTGETSLNELSSRSHQIIRLTIESSSRELLGRDNASTLTASVNFVDLAGSERASQSLSAGARLKEGCHINRSLLTLGTVIRKLSKGRNGHVPYRDSKLTRILQTSLGGNAKTAIICTMSPARCHVEQSRNTLLFASCAKEVTTNAQVNVVMSDKALVKYLQRELERLESALKNPHQSTLAPSNFSAILNEKDLQIEKLEKEIKNLMLQRDIAQSQVKDFVQMLGDNASPITPVGLGNYPHFRVQKSSEDEIPLQETSILADPHSLDVDTRTYSNGHSRTSSEDHYPKNPYFEENIIHTPPRILMSSSNFSESDSCPGWEDSEKQSNGNSEDLCREVRCIETEEPSYKGVAIAKTGDPIKVNSNREEQSREFLSSPPLDSDNEMKEDIGSANVPSGEQEFSSIRFLDIRSLEKLSSEAKSWNRRKSRSCKANILGDPASFPWFNMSDFSENTPSGTESVGFERKISRKDSQCSRGNALDIEVDTPDIKFAATEDVVGKTTDTREKHELTTERDSIKELSKEIEPKAIETLEKNVKDIGLDPIDDDFKSPLSWDMEFKRMQREIIELWHACNVSLVHRTYFFLLFQGDPSDSIYLEVEMRRMKFLQDKFSRGEKTIVNGRLLTLASSAKALRHEREMFSHQMSKKLSEQERESLFLKWGIGLNTKLRKLQLSNKVWSNTESMNHIDDSAYLVAKLVGLIEPGQSPNKEMFGLNFTPGCQTKTYGTLRRSLTFLP